MSITDYVIDILLIAIIFRQVRPRPLTSRSALLPLVLLVAAGAVYLRPFTAGGNDVALIVILCAIGVALGGVSGVGERIWRDDRGRLLARAPAASVAPWVLGMGARFCFAYYADHSGAGAVARFSARHDLTGAGIWTAALVLMAFGQVFARVGVLQARRIAARPQVGGALPRPAPAVPYASHAHPLTREDNAHV